MTLDKMAVNKMNLYRMSLNNMTVGKIKDKMTRQND